MVVPGAQDGSRADGTVRWRDVDDRAASLGGTLEIGSVADDQDLEPCKCIEVVARLQQQKKIQQPYCFRHTIVYKNPSIGKFSRYNVVRFHRTYDATDKNPNALGISLQCQCDP